MKHMIRRKCLNQSSDAHCKDGKELRLSYGICSGVQACALSGLAATCLYCLSCSWCFLFALDFESVIRWLLLSVRPGNDDGGTQMCLTPSVGSKLGFPLIIPQLIFIITLLLLCFRLKKHAAATKLSGYKRCDSVQWSRAFLAELFRQACFTFSI